MLLQLVNNKVKTADKEKYLHNAKKFAEDLRLVDGCLDANIYTTKKEDEVFIVSKWQSKMAMESNEAGDMFLKHKPNLKPYFVKNETTILKAN